jgi:carboxyl-terminal processing protease
MSKRIGISVAAGVAIILLIGGGFGFGLLVGRRMPQTIVVQGVSGIDATSTTADFGAFWQAWQTINENYLKAKDISNENKVRGAITGLVNSLGDPYSEYFSPKDAKSFKDDVNGSFSGIGAEIGTQKGQLVVIAPLKNTPAEKAGLKPNDKILLIDTTSTEGMPIDQAISFIRGPENSTVKLTILRDGWDKPKEFPIVRKSIEAPTLDFKMLPGNIAYVQLYQFNANASRLFWDAMKQASGSDTQGLILDLRGNPGGYLDVAVDLAGWFLPRGTVVVKEEGRNNAVLDTLRASGNEALVKIPVVVLIDKGSASASEILSGALRDDRKVKLVGDTSFGKGTVQEFMDLKDGSTLKLTIAHWVLPSGRILDHDGLVPDYAVKLTDEDIAAKRDPQFDKALEVLKSEMK